MWQSLLSLPLAVVLIACGDDGGSDGGGSVGGASSQGGAAPEGGNGSTAGASPVGGGSAVGGAGGAGGAPSENPLGRPCGEGLAECPEPTACVVQPLIGGSETQGYCSPACAMPSDCTQGYVGSGETTCYGGTCVFSCNANDDCPEGLSCLATGGPTMACGIAA